MTPADRTDGRSAPITASGVLWSAGGRVRGAPRLAVPFLGVGVLLAVADWLRRTDPLPVDRAWTLTDGSIEVDVAHSVIPAGTTATTRPPGALVGLHPEYLLLGLGVELATVLAIAVAGWLTLSRALGDAAERGRRLAYVGVVVLVVGGSWVAATKLSVGTVLGLPLIALALFVQARLFVVPAALVAGAGIVDAVRESNRQVRGHSWRVFGLVCSLGLTAWLLGAVPAVGSLASTAVVGPLHAVAAVVVFEGTAETG